MKAYTRQWLSDLRERAAEPGTFFVVIRGSRRRFVIYPEEIAARTDDQLLAHIRQAFGAATHKSMRSNGRVHGR